MPALALVGTGSFAGPHAAVLMLNMGYVKAEVGDFQGSVEAFQEVIGLLAGARRPFEEAKR